MKFKKSILCLLLCLSLTGLAACGNSATPLSGTYSAETFGTAMTYTFDGDSVTAQFFMGGYEIGRYEGTYSLNNDETQITLSFDPEQMPNGADLPAGLTSLGGTFTFQQGENYVMIGQVRYDRAEGDTENSGQGSVPPHLTLVIPGSSISFSGRTAESICNTSMTPGWENTVPPC